MYSFLFVIILSHHVFPNKVFNEEDRKSRYLRGSVMKQSGHLLSSKSHMEMVVKEETIKTYIYIYIYVMSQIE